MQDLRIEGITAATLCDTTWRKQNFPSHLKLPSQRNGLMNSPVIIATKCFSQVACCSSCEVKVTTGFLTVNTMNQCRDICRGDSYHKVWPEALGGKSERRTAIGISTIFLLKLLNLHHPAKWSTHWLTFHFLILLKRSLVESLLSGRPRVRL